MKKILLFAILAVLIVAPVQAAGIKGLAMATPQYSEDLTSLNISWWYTWSWDESGGRIPMSRDGSLPPSCPTGGFALWLNEPNAVEPYGYPMTPYNAARSVRAMELMCPSTILIVGNVSADDWRPAGGWGSGYNWIKSFLSEYKKYAHKNFNQVIGMHCYSQHTASYCIGQLSLMSSLYAGEEWVTEWAIVDGDTVEFSTLLDYIALNYSRYAVYTNRQPPPPCGWCGPSTEDLVNSDGSLKPNGVLYSQK